MLQLIPKPHETTIGTIGAVFTIGYQCPIVYNEELSNEYMYSMFRSFI
ncbi:hypothetical protein [Anaerosporobacter sp.]